jgi:DNA polymerase II small subunit
VEESEILTRFLKSDLNIHPTALAALREREDVEAAIEVVIHEVEQRAEKPKVITLEDLPSPSARREPGFPEERSPAGAPPSSPSGTAIGTKPVTVHRKRTPAFAEEYEAEIRILDGSDITKKSYSEGKIEGFLGYFNDRFDRLSQVLRERNHLREAVTIEWAKKSRPQEKIKIIGMVNEIRTSKKGNTILELEDLTGTLPIVLLASDREMAQVIPRILKDVVIGVEGVLGKDGQILLGKEVHFPDLPRSREARRSEVPLSLALLSDLHVGSSHFLENGFRKFLRWLRGELGNPRQRELAGKVKYLVIAGDVVDGVGIYPSQEKDLEIRDIYQQYERAAELLSEVPDHIEILISPGNHDATRIGEPQPAIFEEFSSSLYEDPRIHMVGNPSTFRLHGVEELVYHGVSLLDIIGTVPGRTIEEPEGAMEELLRYRHLAPTYGGKTQLVPEGKDYLLIERTPDIFHVGHVHTVGASAYKGVTVINSGTFQSETEFQKKLGMKPTPCKVPILDLSTHRTTIMNFVEGY